MLAVVGVGCKPGIPSGIIKPEKMEKILFDVHIVDGYLSTIYIPDSAKKIASSYYNGIYKKFDIDSVQYRKSLVWYNSNPIELEKMYKNIQIAMSKQKKATEIADLMIKKKKFKADSIVIVKKFKADSLTIRKKMKPDSLSKARSVAEIARLKKKADSLINIERTGAASLVPTLVQ